MLTLPAQTRVLLCSAAVDMRKSFDGLIGVVRNYLNGDPLKGDYFVFQNRNHNRLKILYWDGDGFVIWYKGLEQGTFRFPKSDDVKLEVTRKELAMILEGLDSAKMVQRRRYRYLA